MKLTMTWEKITIGLLVLALVFSIASARAYVRNTIMECEGQIKIFKNADSYSSVSNYGDVTLSCHD
jgi:hypothetical protein